MPLFRKKNIIAIALHSGRTLDELFTPEQKQGWTFIRQHVFLQAFFLTKAMGLSVTSLFPNWHNCQP